MEIFKHRPLCIIISFVTVYMAASPFMSAATKLFTVLAAAGISFLVLLFFRRKAAAGHRVFALLFALVFLFLAAVRACFYYDVPTKRAENIYGTETEVTLKVNDVVYSGSYVSWIDCRVLEANGERINADCLLECSYETDYMQGDTVTLIATIYPSETLIGEGNYTKLQVLSKGYAFYCISENDTSISFKRAEGIGAWLLAQNRRLSARLIHSFGQDSGSLASALALGNRELLSPSVERDFARSGLAHILAISGSHIILILGVAEYLLRKTCVGRRIRYLILLLILPFYVIFVTSPIPVIRAGLMYAIFCVLNILGKRKDGITSLFLSLFIMILVDPSLVFDASLWMSFLSSLALLTFGPLISAWVREAKRKRKNNVFMKFALDLVLAAFIATVGMLSNLVFLWLTFGTLSTVSVITNVVIGPLLTLYLMLIMLILPIIAFFSLPTILAVPISALGRLILSAVSQSASYTYSMLSLRGMLAGIGCAVLILSCAVFMVIKVERKRLILVPLAVFILFVSASAVYRAVDTSDVRVTVDYENVGETLTVSRGDRFSLIDISSGRYGPLAAAARIAMEDGACSFESVVLTHYHVYHAATLDRILGEELVERLLLPHPESENDVEIYSILTEIAESHSVDVETYSRERNGALLEGVSFVSAGIERIERSEHPPIAFSIEYLGKSLLYIGTSANDGEGTYSFALKQLYDADLVIFGAHGPKEKTSPYYPMTDKSELFVVGEDRLCDILSAYKDIAHPIVKNMPIRLLIKG